MLNAVDELFLQKQTGNVFERNRFFSVSNPLDCLNMTGGGTEQIDREYFLKEKAQPQRIEM